MKNKDTNKTAIQIFNQDFNAFSAESSDGLRISLPEYTVMNQHSIGTGTGGVLQQFCRGAHPGDNPADLIFSLHLDPVGTVVSEFIHFKVAVKPVFKFKRLQFISPSATAHLRTV